MSQAGSSCLIPEHGTDRGFYLMTKGSLPFHHKGKANVAQAHNTRTHGESRDPVEKLGPQAFGADSITVDTLADSSVWADGGRQ